MHFATLTNTMSEAAPLRDIFHGNHLSRSPAAQQINQINLISQPDKKQIFLWQTNQFPSSNNS